MEFPVEMQESSIQSLYMIKSNLDYTKFTRDSIEPDKWHAYLELSNEHLIRLQIDEGSFEAETSYLFTDYPYYICLYQTVNENLSVKIERLKIMRDVKSFELNNHRLELRGNSYFINELNSQRFKKEIIIKQRYSNQKVKFQPDYNGNEFYCSISLKHLFIFNSDKQPILDLYIRYSNDHYFIERKLGEENYQFYKDGVLGKGIIRDKSTFNYFYLTNTPSGNLKLQIFSISLLKHLYLRYFQDLDRKLFKHQDVWLVGERYDTAQDTGYYFFKYCREHHPRKKSIT
ncbi:hypothetical protein [Piscibacillus salipiscarius]|uniref:hypothetical protein n=1 Tax=Piscibacillus salipiscarius TaxID=299480 RepID=UPI0006D0B76A|nr:hypothetical protein [Piscibacillus salipiscarius]